MLHVLAAVFLLAKPHAPAAMTDVEAFSMIQIFLHGQPPGALPNLRARVEAAQETLEKAQPKATETGPLTTLNMPGGLRIDRLAGSKAITRARELPGRPEYGAIDSLPKHGTVWRIELPNYVTGGYVVFVDTGSRTVVLVQQIVGT